MPTNKVSLRKVEEFLAGYEPRYQPIWPLLMSQGNAIKYDSTVGKLNFTRQEAVGDIRAKRVTPKDTELEQIAVKDSSKSFKKYFLANQFVQSALQPREDVEGICAQVLEEHNKQFDEILLTGEGTAGNNVVNNALFFSADPNYTLETSSEIANAPDTQNDFYETFMANWSKARELPGKKLVLFYGETCLSKLDSLFPEQSVSVKKLIEDAVGSDGVVARMPKAVTPSGGVNGWLIINVSNVRLHYTEVPSLLDQGVNAEKMYAWHNFRMGSAMVEVLAADGIIRQPVTFEA